RRGSRSMASRPSPLRVPAPSWLDSLGFLGLMSGPPKFRGSRDLTASLTGQIDLMVLIQIGAWAGGALWVIARLIPSALRHGVVPILNPVQITAWLLIAALLLSAPQSPGVLLTAFTLGQYA